MFATHPALVLDTSTVSKINFSFFNFWIIMVRCHNTYCFDITRKDVFFAWRFILNENILFRVTISYQKPFVFLFLCFVLECLSYN